jgi:hypothetical protein
VTSGSGTRTDDLVKYLIAVDHSPDQEQDVAAACFRTGASVVAKYL